MLSIYSLLLFFWNLTLPIRHPSASSEKRKKRRTGCFVRHSPSSSHFDCSQPAEASFLEERLIFVVDKVLAVSSSCDSQVCNLRTVRTVRTAVRTVSF